MAAHVLALLLALGGTPTASITPQSTAVEWETMGCVAFTKREMRRATRHRRGPGVVCYDVWGDVLGVGVTKSGRVSCVVRGIYDGECIVTDMGCGFPPALCG